MTQKGQLLQDPFLNILRKDRIPVSIYLVNGIKLQGQIDPLTSTSCFCATGHPDGLQACDQHRRSDACREHALRAGELR